MTIRTPRTRIMLSTVAVTLFGAGIATSVAQIVATGGAAQIQSPNDITQDQNEDDVHIQAIDENQCVTLQFDLFTDQGVIPAGTQVSCHMMRFDPTMANLTLIGSARFDAPILGVISDSTLLDNSDDDCLTGAGVVFPAAGAEPVRGLEAAQVDRYQRVNECVIRTEMEVTTAQDQIRVITECCDEGDCCDQ